MSIFLRWLIVIYTFWLIPSHLLQVLLVEPGNFNENLNHTLYSVPGMDWIKGSVRFINGVNVCLPTLCGSDVLQEILTTPLFCLLLIVHNKNTYFHFVKVTYLGIRSAHKRVWLVERKPIWLLRAYLTRGDLEPARGNLHVCKFIQDLMNIQIRTVMAERGICSECICPTNVLQLKEGRKVRTRRTERRKEGEWGRKRERRNS